MVWSVWLAASCGSETEGGAMINLVPNTALGTEADLTAQLVSIEMLLDAEGGFNGVGTSPDSIDGFTIADPDQDGAQELLLALDVAGRNSLPSLRLDPGSNQDKSIAIRVRCLNADQHVVAVGGIEAQKLFQAGKTNIVKVALGLLSPFRAPQVFAVTPNPMPPGYLSSLVFYTSTELDLNSLTGHAHVFAIKDNKELIGRVEQVDPGKPCPWGNMWRFIPDQCTQITPSVGADNFMDLRLTLDPEITDALGRGIRDASGNPGFGSTLTSMKINLPFLNSVGLIGFGPCAVDCTKPQDFCCNKLFITIGQDTSCNSTTGEFEAKACLINASGCEGPAFGYDPTSKFCMDDCYFLGGCAEFNQHCVLRDQSGYICQPYGS